MAWVDVSASANAVPQGLASPEDYGCIGDGVTVDTAGLGGIRPFDAIRRPVQDCLARPTP